VGEVAGDRGYCGAASFSRFVTCCQICIDQLYDFFYPVFLINWFKYGRQSFLLINEHNSSPADTQKEKLICEKERTFLRQLISVLPWRSLSWWHSSKQQAAPSEVPLRHDAEHQTAKYTLKKRELREHRLDQTSLASTAPQ
jgi:hypothetical protein